MASKKKAMPKKSSPVDGVAKRTKDPLSYVSKKSSAAKVRMAEEKSKAKGPLTPSEKRDFASMQNAIAEMGTKKKLTGRSLQNAVGAYKKYNVKDSEMTGALYGSLKKDYAKFVTAYSKKKKK